MIRIYFLPYCKIMIKLVHIESIYRQVASCCPTQTTPRTLIGQGRRFFCAPGKKTKRTVEFNAGTGSIATVYYRNTLIPAN